MYYVLPTVFPHKPDWNYLKVFGEGTSLVIYPYNAWQKKKKAVILINNILCQQLTNGS